MFDATFWVAISFVIFCLIIVYKKIPQVINNLLKDMQNISNKIALEAVKKIISNSANDEKMKVINQKNLEKIFINLTNTKAS